MSKEQLKPDGNELRDSQHGLSDEELQGATGGGKAQRIGQYSEEKWQGVVGGIAGPDGKDFTPMENPTYKPQQGSI